MKHITRAKGGTKERRVLVSKIQIPDLWNVVHGWDNIEARDRELILETWHLAHDLLRAVREAGEMESETLRSMR